MLVEGHLRLFERREDAALALGAVDDGRQVVQAEDHVLRRHGHGVAVGGLQNVIGSHHERTGFGLGFGGQRQMDCHLVAVEVGVECGTGQRVQLDGTTLHQHGVKGLNAQTVQGRCTVQQHGVALDNGLELSHDFGLCTLDHLAGGLDVVGNALLHQILHDKGLEQLQSHLLGQTALIHLQLRADDDNGTAGVVNTLAQQVLTEAALLALQQIGKALQCTVVGAGEPGGRGGHYRSGCQLLPAASASRCAR